MVILKLRPRSDFFFTVTGWELTTLRHLNQVVEDNIEELLQRYDVSGPNRAKAQFELQIVEARVPRLFRVPIITTAWSLYEACLTEVSRFFASKLEIPYSVGVHHKDVPHQLQRRWARWNVISQARHFFKEEFGISVVAPKPDETKLHQLRELRNILMHTGGRSSPSRPREWETLSRIAAQSDGLAIDSGYILASRDFVADQIDLVDRSSTHLIKAARVIVTDRGLDK